MKTNEESKATSRKYFASLKAAKDFCNINDRSAEDIMELQKWVGCSSLPNLPTDLMDRYLDGRPIYFID